MNDYIVTDEKTGKVVRVIRARDLPTAMNQMTLTEQQTCSCAPA